MGDEQCTVGYIATENCALLSYYAASIDNFLPTFRDILAVSSSILTLEDGTERFSRNVGKNYHYLLRKNPEERSSQLLRDGSLKLNIAAVYDCLL